MLEFRVGFVVAVNFMFIDAQRVRSTVHKRTNVSCTNTKLLGVYEEVVSSLDVLGFLLLQHSQRLEFLIKV